MIRFILERSQVSVADADWRHKSIETIDGDLVALEAALRRGGYSQYMSDVTHLIGVEVLEEAK